MTESEINLGADGVGSDLSECKGVFDVKKTIPLLERNTQRLDDEAGFIGIRMCPENPDEASSGV